MNFLLCIYFFNFVMFVKVFTFYFIARENFVLVQETVAYFFWIPLISIVFSTVFYKNGQGKKESFIVFLVTVMLYFYFVYGVHHVFPVSSINFLSFLFWNTFGASILIILLTEFNPKEASEEEVFGTVVLGSLYLLFAFIVLYAAVNWDIVGNALIGTSRYANFTAYLFGFFALSFFIASLQLIDSGLKAFLEVLLVFLLPSLILASCFLFWPAKTVNVLNFIFVIIMVVLIFILIEPTIFGSGLPIFSSTKNSSTFQEEEDINHFAVGPHHSYKIVDTETGETFEGEGFDRSEARRRAQEKMEKSLRFKERNLTNLLKVGENQYVHEVTDKKTGKKHIGHGNNQKEAGRSSWHKTRKGN